ncbi:MAG TPA: ATP-binding protein [Micromonosporaceae bacterium]|jgi:anti-sigma regulatory factor (Ser/Thr protein kinase)
MVALTSTAEDRAWLRVDDPAAAGTVRRAAVALGTELVLPESVLADLAIVAMEIATNVARHADDGLILLRVRRTTENVGIEIVAIDRGPGMVDVAESTRDGHSTGGTLGIGLGAISRLASEMDIYSRVGSGTVLATTLWEKPMTTRSLVDGVSRPLAGERVCGDDYTARLVNGRRQVMLCDGLGHGALAALAAQAVVAAFHAAPPGGPKSVLDHIHAHTRHTRGAVVGVAELDPAATNVRFAGVGNIAATVLSDTGRRAMVSLPGIVGQQRREVREFDYPLPEGALVVLHSDGLTERWTLDDYPGLTSHAPVVIAAILLRDAARRRDDASVLVARAA